MGSFHCWWSTSALRAQTPTPAPDLAAPKPPTVAPLDPKLPTIFIAGDSTAARGRGEIQQGWGVPFADYFDPTKVNVANRARGGRSSRTFIAEGSWDKLLAEVKPGDIVLIQFGVNDGGAINEEPPGSKLPLRARGSLPGLGEESQEIDNVVTKQHEVVHTYGWYMRKYIADTKAKGATPIVLAVTVRNLWQNGRIERDQGRYDAWAYEIAKAADVPFYDLTSAIADQFEKMGEEKVKAIYQQDHTHFNAIGADLHAAAVMAGLKGLHPSPVKDFLSAKGEAVAADHLAWLRLPRPADPKLPTFFLIGDSTVRNGRGDGAGDQWGWGDELPPYFDLTKINVVNRAVGGTSSRSYHSSENWQRVQDMIKPGDFVIMQFGTNDNGAVNDTTRARGTIKGIGEETQEIDNQMTKQHEVVHSYGWYIRQFIAEVRAKGATPLVCSLVPRKIWKDGKIQQDRETYAGWAAQVAATEKAPFIDLNEIIADRYDELGHDAVMKLYPQVTPDEHTHTNLAGAEFSASCVIAGLKALPADPLAPYFSAKAQGVVAASPSR